MDKEEPQQTLEKENSPDELNNKVASGVYIYSIQSEEHSEFKKMTLLK